MAELFDLPGVNRDRSPEGDISELFVHLAERPDGTIAIVPYYSGPKNSVSLVKLSRIFVWDPRTDTSSQLASIESNQLPAPVALTTLPGGTSLDPWTGEPSSGLRARLVREADAGYWCARLRPRPGRAVVRLACEAGARGSVLAPDAPSSGLRARLVREAPSSPRTRRRPACVTQQQIPSVSAVQLSVYHLRVPTPDPRLPGSGACLYGHRRPGPTRSRRRRRWVTCVKRLMGAIRRWRQVNSRRR